MLNSSQVIQKTFPEKRFYIHEEDFPRKRNEFTTFGNTELRDAKT